MKKEDKSNIIDNLAAQLEQTPDFYLTDISGLNAETTAKLRRECFEQNIKLVVVKNTLFRKALEKLKIEPAKELYPVMEGSTSVMFTQSVNAPAKLIQSFGQRYGKPVLKAALVQENVYVGENQLDILSNIKSREELIGDIIALILSPGQRLVSAISASGNNIAGIVKTLSEGE